MTYLLDLLEQTQDSDISLEWLSLGEEEKNQNKTATTSHNTKTTQHTTLPCSA